MRLARWSLAFLSACQIAKHAGPEGVRLAETTKRAPPPILAPAKYAVDSTELIDPEAVRVAAGPVSPSAANVELSQTRVASGGETASVSAAPELRVVSKVALPLASGKVRPGKAYALTFSARGVSGGVARVGVTFRLPNGQSYRTYFARVLSAAPRDYRVDFTAPEYTERAELALDAYGAGVALQKVSLTMRPPISVTEPVASWANSYVPPGYGLVFNDEFNGTELDRHKWFTRYIYGSETLDRLNDEQQKYADDDNQRVSGGVLYLTAKRLPAPQSNVRFSSGMIRSDFTLRYGFLEARVKMPGARGVWPAFWANSDASEQGRLTHPPELDFFEFVNNGKDDRIDEIHIGASSLPGVHDRFTYADARFSRHTWDYVAPFNFNEAFHTIGCEWTPDDFTIYVDGVKAVTRTFQWRYADGALAGPAHLLLNLAVGGQWAGRYGIDEAAFPQSLAVDWVRAYRKLDVPATLTK